MNQYLKARVRYRFIFMISMLALSWAYLQRWEFEYLYAQTEQSANAEAFSFEGTAFYYEGQRYELTSCSEAIKVVLSAEPVGDKIVVSGHADPNHEIYCVFDTGSRAFEAKLRGSNLIWHHDELSTAVYVCDSELYAYDGKLLKSYELKENECIYELAFSPDCTEVLVTMMRADGAERKDTVRIEAPV